MLNIDQLGCDIPHTQDKLNITEAQSEAHQHTSFDVPYHTDSSKSVAFVLHLSKDGPG